MKASAEMKTSTSVKSDARILMNEAEQQLSGIVKARWRGKGEGRGVMESVHTDSFQQLHDNPFLKCWVGEITEEKATGMCVKTLMGHRNLPQRRLQKENWLSYRSMALTWELGQNKGKSFSLL